MEQNPSALSDQELHQRFEKVALVCSGADDANQTCPMGYQPGDGYCPEHKVYCEYRALKAEKCRREATP